MPNIDWIPEPDVQLPEPELLNPGEVPNAPDYPDDYLNSFDGWYLDPEATVPYENTEINTDTTLWGVWRISPMTLYFGIILSVCLCVCFLIIVKVTKQNKIKKLAQV
jgi:hypothetical protein